MKATVILEERESGEMSCYPSFAAVEMQLEAIDVENQEFEAFDAEGCLLTLRVDGKKVKVARASDAPQKKEELEAKLRRFVGRFDATAGSMTFEELAGATERRSRGPLARVVDLFRRKKEPNQPPEPTRPSGPSGSS
jgi:hypothetical protein